MDEALFRLQDEIYDLRLELRREFEAAMSEVHRELNSLRNDLMSSDQSAARLSERHDDTVSEVQHLGRQVELAFDQIRDCERR